MTHVIEFLDDKIIIHKPKKIQPHQCSVCSEVRGDVYILKKHKIHERKILEFITNSPDNFLCKRCMSRINGVLCVENNDMSIETLAIKVLIGMVKNYR